jgi:hypothetical protein
VITLPPGVRFTHIEHETFILGDGLCPRCPPHGEVGGPEHAEDLLAPSEQLGRLATRSGLYRVYEARWSEGDHADAARVSLGQVDELNDLDPVWRCR